MSPQQLAELQIQVTSTGFTELYKKLDELKDKLGKQSEQAEKNARSMQAAFAKMASGIQASLGLAGGYVQSFVRQGMALSAEGRQIQLQFEQISFQIASLFAPEIRKVVGWLQQTAAWFRSLSAEGQHQVKMWAGLVVGISTVGAAAPRVAAAISGLATAWKGLSSVMSLAAANPWVLAILAAVAAVVLLSAHSKTLQAMWKELGVALTDAMEGALEVIKKVAETVDQIAAAVGQIIDGTAEAAGAEKGYADRVWDRTKTDVLGTRYNAAVGESMGLDKDSADKLSSLVTAAGALVPGASIFTQAPKLGYNLGLWGAPEGYEEAEAARKKKKDKDSLTHLPRHFESLGETWNRIALAARDATGGAGKSVEQQQLDELQAIHRVGGGIAEALAGMRPAVAR